MRQRSLIQPTLRQCKYCKYLNESFSLENELRFYSVLHKGDTISIQFAGRDYLIDVVDCKPDDQICCVEADINLDFEAPKDYKEPVAVPKAQQQAKQQAAAAESKHQAKVDELAQKAVRIDGGALTQKQKKLLHAQVVEEEKKHENPDFDPRKHRLPKGIRPVKELETFTGQGIRMK